MVNLVTTRTITAALTNDREGVVCDLDSLGRSGSKIWNVARWTISRIWDHTGEIPDEGPLKSYIKNQRCWKDLNSQSSQAIIEELSGAFQSWFEQDDPDANPPGYRKDGDERPRSTVTFKEDGFKLDTKHQQVRLSKGKNLKDGWADFVLCEYDTGPDADLTDVEDMNLPRGHAPRLPASLTELTAIRAASLLPIAVPVSTGVDSERPIPSCVGRFEVSDRLCYQTLSQTH